VAFIVVLFAVISVPSGLAGADELSIYWGSLAYGTSLARVAHAGILQVASQPCLARRTFTVVVSHFIDAGGAVVAGPDCTVIHIHRAVFAGPSIDTDALEASELVLACRSVLAGIGTHAAFVNIIVAVPSFESRRTGASVAFDTIHTGGAMFAEVVHAVINVDFTVLASETKSTATVITQTAQDNAGTSILAR
jgi:hypothetical protein